MNTSINKVLDPEPNLKSENEKKLDIMIIALLAYVLGSSIHSLSNDIFTKYSIGLNYKILYTIILTIIIVFFIKKYYNE